MIAELLNEELAGVLQQGSLHPACACPLASLIEELKPYVPEIHEAIVCVALDWTEEVLGDQDRSAGTDGVAAIILASRVARGNRLPQRLLERMVASPAVAAALPSVHSQGARDHYLHA